MKRVTKKKIKKVVEPTPLASWEEAVMNYKGKLKSKSDDAEAIKQKKIFQEYFDLLEKCEKS